MAWRARSCRSGRARAGTRGSATRSAASPVLRRLAAPHYQTGGHPPAGPGPLEGFGELPKKPGPGKSPPRVPGEERKLERAGAGLRFTLKFPV